MINSIIKFSLSHQYLVLLFYVMLVVLGVRTASRMDIDVFPDLTAPTVVVMTDAHGMASEEVERLVTFPIETAVNGAVDVRRVRSVSSQGFSFVWVEFDWGTNIFKARQVVSEKLITVSAQMPIGVGQPVLAPQSSIMGEILFIGMQADSTSMMDLRTLAEWQVKPLILSTGGVSQVTIMGGDYKQYQVLADPQRMNYYKLSMQELAEACQGASLNSSGGLLRQYGNEYVVRGIGRSNDLETLGNTFIKRVADRPVKIRDVAEVVIGSPPKTGFGSVNAKLAVIMAISKQPNTNTLEVTQQIEDQLHDLRQSLPDDVKLHTDIFRQADFIQSSIRNIQTALVEGGIFVVVILFLFLGSFRTTFISLLAIPLSLLGTILVMKIMGITINTMSLGGMAIAIGSLVDDAIIGVENVYKRLRQNRAKPLAERLPAYQIVLQASIEIRSSIMNATLIIIVAFLPLFFLSGMEGRMLEPLGISFVVALFVSLVVAMTLTPLLSGMLLSDDAYLQKNQKEKWLVRKLAVLYEKSLTHALRYKRIILSATLVLFLVTLLIFVNLGRSFLPEFNEGALTISVVTKPGVSIEESNRLGNLVERELLAIDEVLTTARRTGRGELDEHAQSTNSAEIDVNYTLGERSQEDFMEAVRERLTQIPGMVFTVGQPLGHRIDHMLSGTRANIAIKIFGEDLGRLFTLGTEIQHAIGAVEGLVDVNVDQQVAVPQVQIRANRDRLAQYGISLNQFHDFVELAFAGEKLADIYQEQQRFDLVLRLHPDYTESVDGIRAALIDTEGGKKIPLEQVAHVVSHSGPSSISRENVQRKIVVAANIAGRDLRSVVEDIREVVSNEVDLPEGYRVEYGGQFENEARASRTLMLTSVLSIFIIFLLLYHEFKDFSLAGIILLNLPLALIGGVFAIYFTSINLSIPAVIGFITLFGIATRNGILLISRYQSLQQQGYSLVETITQGSVDRLSPILMTALTAALALIPLALRGDLSGNEIQSPMAKVILGGLLTSTLLNMYIVPVVFSILTSRGLIKRKKEDSESPLL